MAETGGWFVVAFFKNFVKFDCVYPQSSIQLILPIIIRPSDFYFSILIQHAFVWIILYIPIYTLILIEYDTYVTYSGIW